MGMRGIRLIAIRHLESNNDKHHAENNDNYKLPYETEANELMSDEFELYVKKHGYHFTEELAEYASRMMINSNGQHHSWTAAQVKKSMDSLGLDIPSNVTIGDMTYASNMAYADFYPELLKDETSCLKYAHKVANDPDGYEGIIFCRWTADIIGKAVKINWKKFT